MEYTVKKNGGVMFIDTSAGDKLMLVPKYVNSIKCSAVDYQNDHKHEAVLAFVQMYGATEVTTYLSVPTLKEAQDIYQEILTVNKLTDIEDVGKILH